MFFKKSFKFLVLIIFVVASACAQAASLPAGQPAPGAVLPDTGGNRQNPGDYSSRSATVIWITDGCKVCAQGVDNFLELHRKFSGKNIAFFIINTAGKKNAGNFAKSYNFPFPVLLGGDDPITTGLSGGPSVGSCPVNNIFVIDKNGVLKYKNHLPGVPTRDIENLLFNFNQ